MCSALRPARHGARRARGASALALAALLAALALPLLDLALTGEPAPCCGKGSCCCASGAPVADERACLRRSCGCERPDATAPLAPLRLEAVLPTTGPTSPLEARSDLDVVPGSGPLSRPHLPLVPPPKPRPLLASFS